MTTDRTTTDAQVLYDRGHQSFQTGDFREAVECFTRAIRLKPNVAAGYRYRAMAYLEMGQRVDALNDLDQAVRIRSDDPMLYADRARVLFRQRSYPAAIADCTRALELDDGLAPLYGLRGECHAANGDTRQAFADIAVALARDPDNAADYLLARTELHLELEDPDAALADGEEAIRRSPDNPNGYQARGMAYRMAGQFADADADFTRVLELDANRPLTRLARATVRLGVRNYAGAAADCDAVLAVLPATAKAFELRGLCRGGGWCHSPACDPKIETACLRPRRLAPCREHAAERDDESDREVRLQVVVRQAATGGRESLRVHRRGVAGGRIQIRGRSPPRSGHCPDVAGGAEHRGWIRRCGKARGRVLVGREMSGGERHLGQSASLPEVVKRQPRTLPHPQWRAPLEIRQAEGANPVATVRGSEQREERGVLRDREELAVAKGIVLRGKVARKHSDFCDERTGHGVLRLVVQFCDGKMPCSAMEKFTAR